MGWSAAAIPQKRISGLGGDKSALGHKEIFMKHRRKQKSGRPQVAHWAKSAVSIAGTLRRRLRLLYPFRHLRFDRIKIKACAALHRREVEEGLEFLGHHLLNEHKAPELVLEPIKVLLSAFFCPVIWPAGALERI